MVRGEAGQHAEYRLAGSRNVSWAPSEFAALAFVFEPWHALES